MHNTSDNATLPVGAAPAVIHRADQRAHTRLDWLDSRHSFNFGGHHRQGNDGHGLLIVSNDDIVGPGGGFGMHPHRDMEIVTWVLDGRLEHRDSEGNAGVIRPGLAQRMSAGTGIMHAEMNPSSTESVRFVQMWVLPDRAGLAPSYEQRDMTEALATGELVAVASGGHHLGAIQLNQPRATMWVGRLREQTTVLLPDAPFVHLFVATGAVTVGEERLSHGDAARLTQAGTTEVTAATDAEIIVWETDTEVSR